MRRSVVRKWFNFGAVLIMALGGAAGLLMAQRVVTEPALLPSVAPSAAYEEVAAFPGVQYPVGMVGTAIPPGRTNEVFLTDKVGRIHVITNLSAPNLTLFLDVSARTFGVGDAGLVGLAFHPRYDENRQFFVFYTRTNQAEGMMYATLSRFETDPLNPWRAMPESEVMLYSQPDRDMLHSGGDLHFGPDGYLYASVGDEGRQFDVFHTSQRIAENFFSAILRLDVDERPGSLAPNPHPALGTGYRIPPDNPYVGSTSFNGQPVDPAKVRTEFWAVGIRSPHRISFDPATGELYGGDVGGNGREEVNHYVRGANYGWAYFEGTVPTLAMGPVPSGVTFTPPIHEYGRVEGDPNFMGQCVIGGIVYRGQKYPELYGKYIFGDHISKHLWSMTLDTPGSPVLTRLMTLGDGPTSFSILPATGEILIVNLFGVKKLVRHAGPEDPSLPTTLSATGIFADMATLTPRAGVQPYEVAAPFWSDYAIKKRWFFLQDATTQIRRSASDQWSFPAGSVWMKHFDLEMVRGDASTKRRLETRLIVKTEGAVYGLSYRWRDDGSDADLVADGGDDEAIPIQEGGVTRVQKWHFPSRSECLQCHNSAAGYVLGFSTRQLNRTVSTTEGDTNQLSLFNQFNVFDPPFSNPAQLPALAAVTDESVGLERRFKSYVDANCSSCHRPNGPGHGAWDARYSVPLDQSEIVNGIPIEDLGIPGSRIVKPGDPDSSLLWRRIAEMGPNHMPPLGTAELNPAGVNLVKNFIETIVAGAGRTRWQIGVNDDPLVIPYNPSGEFSSENGTDDAPPGSVTRLEGDPLYSPATNPTRDDDFYFAGNYPAGFNGLTSLLRVPNDEPATAWERALTRGPRGDRTNRFHFVLSEGQVVAGARLKLSVEFASGGWASNGVVQPGFGPHDLVINVKNGIGVAHEVFSSRLTQRTNIVLDLDAGPLGLTAGPNTVEFIRPGPSDLGFTYWLTFDYVDLQYIPSSNTPPQISPIPDSTVDELSPLLARISASDANLPTNHLTFELVDGPAGLLVSGDGLVSWTPGEQAGPSTNLVRVRVVDDGVPPLAATNEFHIMVREVNSAPQFVPLSDLTVNELAAVSMRLEVNDPDRPTNRLAFELIEGPDGLSVSEDGVLAWIPGEAQGPSTNLVRVRVTDNGVPPLSATNEFRMLVAEINTAPLFESVNDPTIEPLLAFSMDLHATDLDRPSNHLAFELLNGPSGLSVSPSGLLKWTPTALQRSSTNSVRVRVVDDGAPSLSSTNVFLVVVSGGNQPPVWVPTPDLTGPAMALLTYPLQATDPDLPQNVLTFELLEGPDGLVVNSSGVLTWTPGERPETSTNRVVVRVVDDGLPSMASTNEFRVVVRSPTVPRRVWMVGTDDSADFPVAAQSSEFGSEDGVNDLPPGRVTRLPGDPAYVPTGNPGADDDFYFEGEYPAGFNGLASPLVVANDEPAGAWERALTGGSPSDLTNRLHFVIGGDQTQGRDLLRLEFEFVAGSSTSNGVALPGFGLHNLVVNFRNGRGISTLLYSNQISKPTAESLVFNPVEIGATEGANTVEFVRMGPDEPDVNHALTFDYVRLEIVPITNKPPVLAGIPNLAVDEMTPLRISLLEFASDADGSPDQLTFGLVSGPPGMDVSSGGILTWFPSELLGPSTNLVVVQVTDGGLPPLSATQAFTVIVREVNLSPEWMPIPDQTVDELVHFSLPLSAVDPDHPSNSLSYELVRGPQGMQLGEAGMLSWTPTGQQGPSTNAVVVKVTDDGDPARFALEEFTVVVRDTSEPYSDASLLRIVSVSLPVDSYFTLTYAGPDPNPSGLVGVVEISTDLVNWKAAHTAEVRAQVASGMRETVVRVDTEGEAQEVCFVRLRLWSVLSGQIIPGSTRAEKESQPR